MLPLVRHVYRNAVPAEKHDYTTANDIMSGPAESVWQIYGSKGQTVHHVGLGEKVLGTGG